MEAAATKSFTLAIAAISALLLLSPGVCRANAVESGNQTTPFSAGHPENGLIGDAYRQSEFMLDSDINNMLAALDFDFFSSKASIRYIPAVACGRGKPYTTCLPPRNKPKPGRTKQKCSPFTRGCHDPSS